MITFKRILFPVDFSARNAAGVPSVLAMVQRFGAELTVLHVVDLPQSGIAPPEAAAWATLIGADRLRQQGRLDLDGFIARHFPGMKVKSECTEGAPATRIVEYAQEGGADLIMMPTSGVGPFRLLLLGSVTAKVLHDTAVPVWTGVHAEEIAAHSPDRWKHILCALNDDPRDLPLLKWVGGFATEQKLEVRLVHAVRVPAECQDNVSLREFLFDVARERIAQLQAQAGTKFDVSVEIGKPGPVTHRAAISHPTDVVVIGRGVIQKAFGRLRSSAYEIIREAPCPVISV